MRWGRSVVHVHYTNLVIGFDRIVAADEQPKGASQQNGKEASKQGLVVQIALKECIVTNDDQAKQDEED